MFAIKVTHRPSSRFGIDEAEEMPGGPLFGGFRTRTTRNARMIYGDRPEVTLAGSRKPATWATREAAERNVARLAEHGYAAEVVPFVADVR